MVKIELLDYVYDSEGQNQVNFNNATSTGSWTVISSEEISISSAVGTQTITPVTGELALGNVYKSVLTVSGMSGSGFIGYQPNSVGGTAIGWGSTHRRSTDGQSVRTFTATAGGAGSEAEIYAGSGMSGVVRSTLALNTGVNFTKSIIGVLDVGNSTDFPLALNFSIAEARDLEARTGTYSKTFDIPATKHNNALLKGAYEVGSIIKDNQINTRKDCRIIIDDIYSLSGKLQIQSIGTDSTPQYYSCVFYGDNIDWVSAIDNKLLMDLAVKGGAVGSGWDNLNGKGVSSGKNLQVNEPSIVESWGVNNALTRQLPGGGLTANNKAVIYPLAGYGLYNTDGEGFNMQLYKTKYELDGLNANETGYYGFFSDGTPYPNKVPTVDWRPAIFIYDIIHGIFKQEGYTINSTFIESPMFKKLVMLLPNFIYNNPQEREDANSIRITFSGANYLQYFKFLTPSDPFGTFRWSGMPNNFNNINNTTGIQFDSTTSGFTSSLNTSMYDNSTGRFTIPEYGFYDIEIKNFGVWIRSFCEGTAWSSRSYYLQMEVYLLTVGSTAGWQNIAESYAFNENKVWSACPRPNAGDEYNSFTFEPIDIKDRYFNKGDRIEIRLKAKTLQNAYDPNPPAPTQTVGWLFDFFCGSNPDNANSAGGTGLNVAQINITHHGDKVEYGQTYDLKNVIDNESTQLDFLKGVIHAFNLQMTTDVNTKSVNIEPFNDFYSDKNEAIDWSDKLDLSKEQEDKFVKAAVKREFVFKYKEDSADKKVEARGNKFFDGIIDNYPYREYLSDEFEMGVTTFENPFFSGTYSSGDVKTSGGNATSFSVTPTRALLWGNCEEDSEPYPWGLCRPPKGYEFRPRLLHYIKDDCSSSGILDGYPVKYQVGAINFEFYDGQYHLRVILGGDPQWPSNYKQNPYVQRGRVFSYDRTGHYLDVEDPLTYNSLALESYSCVNNLEYAADPKRGLYQKYYQGMIEMLKTNPRIKTAYFNLKISDINKLDLRKLIYVDGYYYRINRIIDYSPNTNEVTKVELVLFDLQKLWPVDTTFNRQ